MCQCSFGDAGARGAANGTGSCGPVARLLPAVLRAGAVSQVEETMVPAEHPGTHAEALELLAVAVRVVYYLLLE